MNSDIDIYLKSIFRKWKASCSLAEDVVIVSPYITSKTAEKVTSTITPENCEINTLFNAEVFVNLSSSVHTLINLKKSGFKLYSVPNLHAKLIITSNDVVTVGSQNLTDKGRKNIEATIITTDSKVIHKVRKWLVEIEKIRTELTIEMLEDMKVQISPLIKKYKLLISKSKEIDSTLIENEKRRLDEIEKRTLQAKKEIMRKLKIQETIDKRKLVVAQIRSQHTWLGEDRKYFFRAS